MENQSEKKWYQKPTAVVLFLIFFFPVGLILMWKHEVWSKTARWVVTGLFALAIIANANKNLNTNNVYSGTWSTIHGDLNSRLHGNYPHYIQLEFSDGKIEAFEMSDGLKSCVCEGNYKTDKSGDVKISGISNSNCPWMSKVNGAYYRDDNDRYYILENSYLKVAKTK